MIIKCFSLTEPWASAMRLNLKRNETRDRRTNYRGWLAIASTKQQFDYTKYNSNWNAYLQSLGILSKLIYGKVHCIVKLQSCIPTEQYVVSALNYNERMFGDYGPNRHVWETDSLIVLPEPVPVQGKQWLFDWKVPEQYQHFLKRSNDD